MEKGVLLHEYEYGAPIECVMRCELREFRATCLESDLARRNPSGRIALCLVAPQLSPVTSNHVVVNCGGPGESQFAE